MFLPAVRSVLVKLILTNNDGHFECLSLNDLNIYACLEARLDGVSPISGFLSGRIQRIGKELWRYEMASSNSKWYFSFGTYGYMRGGLELLCSDPNFLLFLRC